MKRCIALIFEKVPGAKKYLKRRCTRRARLAEGYCIQHGKDAMKRGKIEKRRL